MLEVKMTGIPIVTPAQAGVQSGGSGSLPVALDPGQPLRVFRGDDVFGYFEFHLQRRRLYHFGECAVSDEFACSEFALL